MRQRGVTLIELVVVMVIAGIVASTVTLFLKPAVDSYFSSKNRADLTDISDTALRRIARDVQSAVPNSLRSAGSQCVEVVPSSMGGRYRMGPDTDNDSVGCTPSATCSAPLDISQPVSQFDVLSEMPFAPAANDWVVIGNQNANDVYAGASSSQITGTSTPARSGDGTMRISIGSKQFAPGYDQGRFFVVPNNGGKPAVIYICSGADGTLDSSGNGKGTLYRLERAFNSSYPTSCPATTGAAIVATSVRSCNFVYSATQGATQQNGFLWMLLTLAKDSEQVSLTFGVHVDNVP